MVWVCLCEGGSTLQLQILLTCLITIIKHNARYIIMNINMDNCTDLMKKCMQSASKMKIVLANWRCRCEFFICTKSASYLKIHCCDEIWWWFLLMIIVNFQPLFWIVYFDVFFFYFWYACVVLCTIIKSCTWIFSMIAQNFDFEEKHTVLVIICVKIEVNLFFVRFSFNCWVQCVSIWFACHNDCGRFVLTTFNS